MEILFPPQRQKLKLLGKSGGNYGLSQNGLHIFQNNQPVEPEELSKWFHFEMKSFIHESFVTPGSIKLNKLQYDKISPYCITFNCSIFNFSLYTYYIHFHKFTQYYNLTIELRT